MCLKYWYELETIRTQDRVPLINFDHLAEIILKLNKEVRFK
jgi:hypothetical protein